MSRVAGDGQQTPRAATGCPGVRCRKPVGKVRPQRKEVRRVRDWTHWTSSRSPALTGRQVTSPGGQATKVWADGGEDRVVGVVRRGGGARQRQPLDERESVTDNSGLEIKRSDVNS